MLGLFCELVREAGLGPEVADIGCGTGRLDRHLAAQGLSPRGLDLSPVMIEVVASCASRAPVVWRCQAPVVSSQVPNG